MKKIIANNILCSLWSFDCKRDLYSSDWVDDNPDEIERLNELGIMSANRDNDINKSLSHFQEAISKGCVAAMSNGFTVLWTRRLYQDACSWLDKMCNKPTKNIKCLWDNALLHFYGNAIEDNPIKQNKRKAIEMLEYIVSHYFYYLEGKDFRILQKAYIFMLKHSIHRLGESPLSAFELWKKMNIECEYNYAVIGHNMFIDFDEYQGTLWAMNDMEYSTHIDDINDRVFTHLDELYLPIGWKLGYEYEDIRGFHVWKSNLSNRKPLNQSLIGTCSKLAAWQAYLLYSWYRCMPLEDHDNYDACRPIFNKNHLSLWGFDTFMPDNDYDVVIEDLKSFFTDEVLRPTVEYVGSSKNQFVISCVWWNDWRGLFREKAIVEFDKHNRPTMKVLSSETLYKYWCPVEI